MNIQKIQASANKYSRRGAFKKGDPSAYAFACRKGILDLVCSHMELPKTQAYSDEELQEEALKYLSKNEFQTKNQSAYRVACKKGLLEKICSHMEPSKLEAYKLEELQIEASKYNDRMKFQKNSPSAYQVAWKRGVLDQICGHMKESQTGAYSYEELLMEALKYPNRVAFQEGNGGAYGAALRRGVVDKICKHMRPSRGSSNAEKDLLEKIKAIYPSAKTIKDRAVRIFNKPYIKGFDIDVFIPELNKGIEFDGKHYHSFKFMRSQARRKEWSDDDIRNYHELKDSWFLSKGIQILHIKEEDWIKDKSDCIKRCLEFLSK